MAEGHRGLPVAEQNGSAPSSATVGGNALPDDLALDLLQLCFDEAEFGADMRGALRPPPSPVSPSTKPDATMDTVADFNAKTFVAEKLEHVSVEVLQRDLDVYARRLEQAVLKCVHDEVHEAFVEVSGQLVSLEPSIKKVQLPLQELQLRLGRAQAALAQARVEAQADLDRAAAHEQRRAFYAAVLEASLIHNAVRRGLDDTHLAGGHLQAREEATAAASGTPTQPSASPPMPASGTAPVFDFVRLQRLCSSVVRLRDVVATALAMAPPAVDSSDPAAAEEDERLQQELAAAAQADHREVQTLTHAFFLAAYDASVAKGADSDRNRTTEAGDPLAEAVQLYRLLQDEGALGEVLRTRIVQPAVEEIVTWRAANATKGSGPEAGAEVQRLFSSLQHALETSVLPVVRRLQHHVGPAVSLVATAVWPGIADTLQKRLLNFFSPGIPDAFHRNFTVAARLLSTVEATCATVEELEALRWDSPDMALWRSKWNLEVYHQVRVAESHQRLTDSKALVGPFVASAESNGSAASGSPFSIPQFAKVANEAAWLLDGKRVLLFPLLPRVFEDVFQTISQLVTNAANPKEGETVAQSTSDRTDQQQQALDLMLNFRTLAHVLSTTARTAVAACEATEEGPTKGLSLGDSFGELLAGVANKGMEAMRTKLVRGLVDGVMKFHQNIASVKRFFSTNPPMPTQASTYLRDSLKGINSFQQAAIRAKALSEAEVRAIVVSVMDAVTVATAEEVKRALDFAVRQEGALDRLRNRGAGAGEGGDATTSKVNKPRWKIVVQLYLDVHAFGDQLRAFGINKEAYGPFQELLGLVDAPARWALGGGDGPEP